MNGDHREHCVLCELERFVCEGLVSLPTDVGAIERYVVAIRAGFYAGASWPGDFADFCDRHIEGLHQIAALAAKAIA
jgi:hypothetical protein